MNFLFWICWVLDILIIGLLVLGSGFRSSFGASTDLNSWLLILIIVIAGSSLVLRFLLKHRNISLAVAAVPLIVLVLMYLFEKKTKFE